MLDMFAIQGNTVKLVATTTAAPGTLVSTGSVQGAHITNASTSDVYIALGLSSTVQAAIPTSATPAYGTLLPGVNSHQGLDIFVPPGAYLSAITSASTSAPIFATPEMRI